MIHCVQEIPCNPCSTVCPTHSIHLTGDPIMGIPEYQGKCTGCGKCVTICPGLAITLVDFRQNPDEPLVTIPYELSNHRLSPGDRVQAVDIDGQHLADLEVEKIREQKKSRMQLVVLKASPEIAARIVSFRIQKESVTHAPCKKR